MNRILKTLLLWLLIVALPSQGAAAAITASCKSVSSNTPSAVLHTAIPHSVIALHHSHQDGNAVAHPAAPDDVSGFASGDPPEPRHLHEGGSCSACAACCVGASAPPSQTALSAVSGHMSLAIRLPATAFSGFIPAGPERPPRPLSV
jgi:hypothetical protein